MPSRLKLVGRAGVDPALPVNAAKAGETLPTPADRKCVSHRARAGMAGVLGASSLTRVFRRREGSGEFFGGLFSAIEHDSTCSALRNEVIERFLFFTPRPHNLVMPPAKPTTPRASPTSHQAERHTCVPEPSARALLQGTAARRARPACRAPLRTSRVHLGLSQQRASITVVGFLPRHGRQGLEPSLRRSYRHPRPWPLGKRVSRFMSKPFAISVRRRPPRNVRNDGDSDPRCAARSALDAACRDRRLTRCACRTAPP